MKRYLALTLVFVFILSLVSCGGINNDLPEHGENVKYGYVIDVERNAFIVSINDVGYVRVKYSGAKDVVEVYDTVIISYDDSALIEKGGTYIDDSWYVEKYEYTLEKLKSFRVADPSKGDLVFG